MKKSIIILGLSALLGMGMTIKADEPGDTGHSVEVTPGDWDDDDPKLNFNFQDIPQASFKGLRLTLTCGLPDAYILYTTSEAPTSDADAWTRYSEPIELSGDCTVRFFARCEGYEDSDVQEFNFTYADFQVAAPEVAPDMDKANMVMVTSTPDAVIRYTTDGTQPVPSSTLYEGPVAIEANVTFRARAFAEDMFDSEVTEYVVDFLTVAPPTAQFENKMLTLTSDDPKASIHYTFDESAPIADSDAWSLYTAPLQLSEDCNIRFYGSRDGYNDSEVQNFTFAYSAYQVAAPVLTADGDGSHVEMICDTPGAEIHYTTDGTDPTINSTLYSGPVEIVSNGVFRARAFVDGMFESNVTVFTVMHLAVPTPVASFENKKLQLTCSDSKATLFYTTDETATPDNVEAWTEYKAPIELTQDCTIRFYGHRDNFNDSDVQSFSFVYAAYQVADPTIERNAEGTHIVMETATPGAVIHYTVDGTEPTSNSAVYTEPILIDGNFTYNAFAMADGMFDSKTNRYVVSNMAVTAPLASFVDKKMVLSCADDKAQILYTINPDAAVEDEGAWTLYTSPITLDGDCTLRFFSRRPNYNNSDIESLTFVYSAYQAQAPAIYRNAQGTHIEMVSNVEGAQIRYTSDGSIPTVGSALYEAPLLIEKGATYRARVFADNMFDSEVTEYAIGNDQLNAPVASYVNFAVVLSSEDEGAPIWYTSDPELTIENVAAWTLYSEPIPMTEDGILRFFAGDDDANASDVQMFVFQRADYQVGAPTVERNEEGTHIVMETPTEGAIIRYTSDGTEPNENSTLYTAPVEITCNATFRAKAFLEGMFESIVTDFVVANVAMPVAYASFANKEITLTCSDPEAQIWYTTDDDAVAEDDEVWSLYTAPVLLTEDCFVHFFTRRENFNDSDIETFVFVRSNYQAAAPVITRSDDERSLIMTAENEGAEIRYTTDGTEPTQESELYTEPIFITQNGTYRARVFVDGLFESSVIDYTVANMTMMMPYASFENLLLTLSIWDEAASIWYTLNPDAAPEDYDEWTLYTEPISFDSDCTVRFFARRSGFLDSQISTYEHIYADYQVAAPEISVDLADMVITISCETEGAEIHYTLDGTEPSAESNVYVEPTALPGNCIVKAIAMKEGMYNSAISELAATDMTVSNPTATFENLALTLAVDDILAQILYTTDAEASVDNDEAWTIYTEPLTFTDDCTVRFFARREAYNDSEVMSFTHIYAEYQVSAPVITLEEGMIAISCETEGAEIHYTLDGTEPSAESNVYVEPTALPGNCIVKAIAMKEGMYNSAISELAATDMTVSNPTATFENLALTLAVDDILAQILYTTDAEASVDNDEAWTIYTEPLTFTDDCTVRFFARREAYNDSEVMSFTHIYAEYQAAAPIFTEDTESNTVVISSLTEGAVIRYTLDGSEPTEYSDIYIEPLEATNGLVINARAFADGLYDSVVSEFIVSGGSGVETINFDGLKVCKEAGNVVVYSEEAIELPIYSLDGHLVKIVNVVAGRNVIDDLDSNIYIIGNVKIKL